MATKRRSHAKNSLYLSVLDEAEALEFKNALSMDGLDAEIALLRVQIKQMLSSEGKLDTRDLYLVLTALSRLISIRYHTTSQQKKGIKEAIGNVLRDIAFPLGLKVGEKFLSRNP